MKVAVVGCGYVGLVSGVGLASVGHEVVGIEIDDARRGEIAAGRPPFHEPGLAELLEATLASGAFRVDGSLESALDAEVVLLAVQTPPRPDGANDLRYLEAAATALGEGFARRPARRVVATRSTVVPGTADTVVAPALAGAGVLDSTAVASNPEFLREGTAVEDYLHPDRIVIGCREDWGRELLAALYEPFDAPVVTMPPAAAELSKYASNALLATMVSFSNEIARICEHLPGVDVEDVLGSLHLDRRLTDSASGHRAAIVSYLRAGCGYGGSCLPKDLSALIAHSRAAGGDPVLLEAVRRINDTQGSRVVDLVERALGGNVQGRCVAVLGAAFKGGTDDLRASPGLRIVDELLARGAEVILHDPLVQAGALSSHTARGVVFSDSLPDAVARADACVLASNAPEYTDLSGEVGAGKVVVDGRRAVAAERFDPAAFHAVGRGLDG